MGEVLHDISQPKEHVISHAKEHDANQRKETALIKELLYKKRLKLLKSRIEGMRPADVAAAFDAYSVNDIKSILSLVNDNTAAEIIGELDPDFAFDILKGLGQERVVRILDELHADEKVDILSQFPEAAIDSLLNLMEVDEAREVKELLQFDDNSAGGLMTTEALYFEPHLTVSQMLMKIREHRAELETANYIYITDSDRRIVGILTLRQLIMGAPDETVGNLMEPDVVTVHLDDDQETVASMVSKYDLLAIPVIDDDGVLRGIITVDDIIDVLEEEATEDIYRMVGLGQEEELDDSALLSALRRMPWLTFTLFGAICSGSIISFFTASIRQFEALLMFMPAIMGMGGNTGLQSSTIVIRGLATGEIEKDDILKVAFREFRVGLLLGLFVGLIVSITCFFLNHHVSFGLVVGTAMFCQISLAVSGGMIIPIFLDRAGLDPAIASGPIVTMISDINGLLIYFGIATLMIDYLRI
jgi:magnesium transporter